MRWEEQNSNLEKKKASVWLEALFASAFMVYLGRHAESSRRHSTETWTALLKKYDSRAISFDFTKFIGADKDYLQWYKWGLPCDDLCLQNAAIVSSNKRKVRHSNE